VAVLIARSAPMFNEFYGGYNRPIGLEEENKNVISRWAHHTLTFVLKLENSGENWSLLRG
jgi:hypothetical protein